MAISHNLKHNKDARQKPLQKNNEQKTHPDDERSLVKSSRSEDDGEWKILNFLIIILIVMITKLQILLKMKRKSPK